MDDARLATSIEQAHRRPEDGLPWTALTPEQADERLAMVEEVLGQMADQEDDPDGTIRRLAIACARDLAAEIRRLRAASAPGGAIYEQAYSNGESNGHADIASIILEADDLRIDDAGVIMQIKDYLGLGRD